MASPTSSRRSETLTIRALAAAIVLGGGLAVSGCASWGPPVASPTASQRLEAVPFWPQTRYQCGPAALASALNSSGVAVTPRQLEGLVYLPERRGSLQAELRAAPRQFERLSYALPPEPTALQASLAEGRPVLVLLNLGVSWLPVWHYAVVIGLSPDSVWLHSGTREALRQPWPDFARQWQRADRWAMVVTRPDELPAALDQAAIVDELSAVEGDFPQLAGPAYETALQRWPDSLPLTFGSGTVALVEGRFDTAAQRFEAVLQQRPGSVAATNNLALAYRGLGRSDEARTMLADLLDRLPADSPWRAAVLDSLCPTQSDDEPEPAAQCR